MSLKYEPACAQTFHSSRKARDVWDVVCGVGFGQEGAVYRDDLNSSHPK